MKLKRARRLLSVLLLFLLLLCACTGEKGGSAPSGTVSPAGSEAAAPTPAEPLPPLQPSVAATDGPVAAGNRPPQVVSVKLTPEVVYPGSRIKAEATAADADGDLITFEYEWRRNDEILADTTMDELDTTGFRKGDVIAVVVTPSDTREKGKSGSSRRLLIQNRPPEITSYPAAEIDAGKYLYAVKASDADGDALTYSIEEAPTGMDIDTATGRIEWQVPKEMVGNFKVRVVVSDGEAKAFQEFSLTLKKE